MSTELMVLLLATVLLIGQFLVVAVRANRELGSAHFLGPRDADPPGALTVGTARLRRAYENHREWILPFAVAVLALETTGKTGGLTAGLAWIYLAARIVYVPAYLYGWTPGRSIIWTVGFLATILMLGAALI